MLGKRKAEGPQHEPRRTENRDQLRHIAGFGSCNGEGHHEPLPTSYGGLRTIVSSPVGFGAERAPSLEGFSVPSVLGSGDDLS